MKLAHIYLQSHLPTPYSPRPCFCIHWDSVYVLRLCFVQGRGALQDIDQMSLFKPLCKYCATVNTVREIVPTLRKAIQAAQSGTPGWKRFFLKKKLIFLGGGEGGGVLCMCVCTKNCSASRSLCIIHNNNNGSFCSVFAI